MGVPISNVPRRVVYAASGTGPYAFTFEILANTDIAVYKDDTLLTLTTDYTVTIASNGTGSITLTASPTGATQIAIVGNRTIKRTTDFVTGGDFFANTINDELDQQTIFAQQNAEGLARALQAPQTDPTSINMTLPRKADRANKYLAFDNDGNPKPGDTAIDVASVAAIADEIAAVAAIAADVTTAADNLADIQAAPGAADDAQTAATAAAASETAAAGYASAASSSATSAANSAAAAAASLDSFDDRYLGSKSSDPTVDNDGNALVTGALYYRTTSPVGMKVYDGSGWLAASAASVQILTTYQYTATAGQTTFTGTDNNGLTLAYNAGCVLVTRNGVILEISSEVTASNGTSVVLASGASVGDEVNVIAFTQFNVADAALKANNLSDLPDKAAARSNLGLTIGTQVQEYDADTAKTDVVQSFTAAQRGTVVALTDGATITPDFAAGNNFSVTLGGNRTLANPSNLTAGQSGVIVITQDGTGSRTLAYGSYFKFAGGTAPTLTTTANAVDVIAYYVESSTRITARLIGDVK